MVDTLTKDERYNRSPKGKARSDRYRETEKGRANVRRYRMNAAVRRRAAAIQRYEEDIHTPLQ